MSLKKALEETFEIKEWLSPCDRILDKLSTHRAGLWHQEFRRLGIHPTHIKRCKKLLIKKGLITIKKGVVIVNDRKRRVKVDLWMLTEKGTEQAKRFIPTKRLMASMLNLFKSGTVKEKFEILRSVYEQVFNVAIDLYKKGDKSLIERFDVMVEEPLKDAINKPWIDNKDAVLVGEPVFIIDPDGVTGMQYRKGAGLRFQYYHPWLDFANIRVPIGFVLEHARVCWDFHHWLDIHARYVLEKLAGYSKEDIEDRNREWLKKYKGKSESELTEIKRNERDERLRVFKERIVSSEKEPVSNIFHIDLDNYEVLLSEVD